jgi:protein-tyrosine phosphatase
MIRVRYNTLIPDRIFIGSERDAQDMIEVAGCEYIVDLRGEASKPSFSGDTGTWIHIGMSDHASGQESKIKQAVETIADLYHQEKTIGIHCESGICRTAAVSVGVLLELGFCKKLKEAVEFVEISRKQSQLHPKVRETLQNLYR